MFFKKKKQETPAKPMLPVQEDVRSEMYQAILQVMKTALTQPNRTMPPEELLEKLCPAGLFSEEERAKLLQEALEQ